MVDNSVWRRLNRAASRRVAGKRGISAGELEQGPYEGSAIVRPVMGGGYRYNGAKYPTKESLPKQVRGSTPGHNTKIPSKQQRRATGSGVTVPAAVASGVASVVRPQTDEEKRVDRAKAASKTAEPKPGSIDAVAQSLLKPQPKGSQASSTRRTPKASATTPQPKPKQVATPRANPKRMAPAPRAKPVLLKGQLPKKKPNKPSSQGSWDSLRFGSAFSAARSKGMKEFSWRGKRYNTKLKA